MAKHYFPEVAQWFNEDGIEGCLHMIMGEIAALRSRLEEIAGANRPTSPPVPEHHEAAPEEQPKSY